MKKTGEPRTQSVSCQASRASAAGLGNPLCRRIGHLEAWEELDPLKLVRTLLNQNLVIIRQSTVFCDDQAR